MKSIDGGNTWNMTTLNYALTDYVKIEKVYINPINTNIILVATSNGLYRSIDNGVTWNVVLNGSITDLETNPSNPLKLFAAIYQDTTYSSAIYRSEDGGISWASFSFNQTIGGGRISIATTLADTSVVYLWSACTYCDSTLFKSENGGVTFYSIGHPDSITGTQGGYDCALAVSPTNPNNIWIGGIGLANSNDGGISWSLSSDWHVDHHAIEFSPHTPETIFVCNDGGINKSTNNGSSWSDLSNGLNIKQYYRLNSSASNPNRIVAGAQDNGTDAIINGITSQLFGGDGMECEFDFTNGNIVYTSYQGGVFFKHQLDIHNLSSIGPEATSGMGSWITPFLIDPTNHNNLYVGYSNLYKSSDAGSTWINLGDSSLFNYNLTSIEISPSDPNTIYVSNFSQIFKTTNGGSSWMAITPTSILNNTELYISDIAADPSNSNLVFITIGGFTSGEKVYYSTNAGSSWTNVSGSLPNIPVNCAVSQNTGLNSIYIGTDLGVFYKDNTLTDWVYYNDGLPNVMVDDLEILNSSNKLRAATYGRGIWETNLDTTVSFHLDAGIVKVEPEGLVCGQNFNPSVKIKNLGTDTIHGLTIQYSVDNGNINNQTWYGNILPGDTVAINITQTLSVVNGGHSFWVRTMLPNNSIDNNFSNDITSSNFNVYQSVSLPLVENFDTGSYSSNGWTTGPFEYFFLNQFYDALSDSLYSCCSQEAFGSSIYGSQIQYFTSPVIDLSSAIAPAQIEFYVAYNANLNSNKIDSLIVEISTDCGLSFTPLYLKYGSTLATVPYDSGSFMPNHSNKWRKESINLNQFIGNSSTIIRFKFISNGGNVIHFDNINIHDSNVSQVSELSELANIKIYPNPAHNQLNILGLPTSEKVSISIFNSLGQKIFETPSTKKQIDIENYKTGLYTIKISTSRESISLKYIKD